MLEAEKKTHKIPAMHHKLGVPPETKAKLNMTKAMTKAEACQHLIDVGGVFKQWSALLNETMGKKQGTVVSKPVKAKAKAAPVKTKAVAPKKVAAPKAIKAKVVEDDLELEELKQLAELEDAPM